MLEDKRLFISCFIIIPNLLFCIDSDLEQMNYLDNKKIKESSPFFTTRAGYAYSNWKMQDMSSFKQETQGLNLAWIDLIYKGNMDDVDGYKNYLHYERSFNKNWDEKIIYQDDSMKDNYELIVGKFSPFNFSYDSKLLSFFIKGSMERYLSRISSKGNTGFINQKGELYNLSNQDSLVFETKFNEVEIGFEPFIGGGEEYVLFFNDYQKPFTIRKNNDEVRDFNHLLFYSKVKTYGFGVNFGENQESSKGLLTSLSLKVGWADIELMDDLKLINLDFKQSQYFQCKLKLGYSFTPIESIKDFNIHMLATYDVRYFNEPDAEGKITMFSTEGGTNKDDIMKAFVSLQYSF